MIEPIKITFGSAEEARAAIDACEVLNLEYTLMKTRLTKKNPFDRDVTVEEYELLLYGEGLD